MAKLFNHNLIRHYIQSHQIDDFENKIQVIRKWKRSLETNKGAHEQALRSGFLNGIFKIILGYEGSSDSPDEWTLDEETSTDTDATFPDGKLGFFYSIDDKITHSVIELKSPTISLDKKQAHHNNQTPVEQAFNYASKIDRCEWIIVSNMIEIRLYKKQRGQTHYETFYVKNLDFPEELKKFHFLLCRENLIKKEGKSPTLSLSEETKDRIKNISEEFYGLYRNLRIELLEELKKHNEQYDGELLLEKAQKFLDRIIFICFCEDMALLPPRLLHTAIERGKTSFFPGPTAVWNEIKDVFRAIDIGHESRRIPPYDGGLFQYDEILDELIINNEFFSVIYDISAYDFSSDLDVNILGHIFEQSISDIEEIKADMKHDIYDAQKSRRKKHGIYYTPENVTDYIVSNTLGKYLENIKKELGEDNLPTLNDIELAPTPQAKGKRLNKVIRFYEKYGERLQQIKILDPAVGSGAFLNKCFDYLLEEYQWIHDQISLLRKGQLAMFDSGPYQRNVLKENLYGVDLNEESVEITKLSLWLKTADSRNPLPCLDDNIKCGDSLISDTSIAGSKAFNWHEEFPEIMKKGGFDIIIGNPPYVDSENMTKYFKKERDYLSKAYETTRGNWDLYIPFIELTFKLLNHNGKASLITPNKWLSMNYGSAIRNMIKDYIYLLADHSGYKVFEDAGIFPVVFFVSKEFEPVLSIEVFSFENMVRTSTIDKKEGIFKMFDNFGIYLSENVELLKKIIKNNGQLGNKNIELSGAFTTSEAYELIPFIEDKFIHNSGDYLKLVNTGTIDRYISLWGIRPTRYIKKIYKYPVVSKSNLKENFQKRFEKFNRDKVIISGIRHFECFYDRHSECLPGKSTVVLLNHNKDIKYELINAILNSKLVRFYLIEAFSTSGMEGGINYSPAVISTIPFPHIEKESQELLIRKSKLLEDSINSYLLKVLNTANNSYFLDLIDKYGSHHSSGKKLKDIVEDNFYNKIYEGRASKIFNIAVNINDNILTLYNIKSKSEAQELVKFEVKEKLHRQYLKLYLEGLTGNQIAKYNKLHGNVLDKVMQIQLPDYGKPEVIKKVVTEYTQHEEEINELLKNISKTDTEIDKLVYELYCLNEEEIKIVEESLSDV